MVASPCSRPNGFAIECSKLKLDVLTTVLLLPLVSGHSYEDYLSLLLSVCMKLIQLLGKYGSAGGW